MAAYQWMNYLGRMEDGAAVAIWGFSSDVKLQTTKSGKVFANFSIWCGNQDDNKQFMHISAYAEAAQVATQITKGDMVYVLGHFMIDEYWTEKKGEDVYKVKADCIFNQAIGLPSQMTESAGSFDDGLLMNL